MTANLSRGQRTQRIETDNRVVVEFDQHSPSYRAGYPQLGHGLRSQSPVVWSEQFGGYWVVTGRDEVGEIAKHPELFSNDHDPKGVRQGYQGVAIPASDTGQGGFLEMDPPEQLEYRQILSPFLSPTAVAHWSPRVTDVTRSCLDEVIESGWIDFVDNVANVVPAVVTMGLLGLPLTDWEVYCEPAHAMVYTAPGSPDFPRVVQGTMRMAQQLAKAVDAARTRPRPGIVKALIDAQRNGASLDDEGILGTVTLIIGGGFDTTTALTAHALDWLSPRPELRQLLMEQPDLIDTATEEFLRYVTPAQGGGRTVTRDCVVAGHRFRAGERVWLAYGLSNHDPNAFAEPDRIILDRFPNRHAAFGLGTHRCIGSNLARMMFKIMLSEVLRRLPDYRCQESATVHYENIGIINGYQHLPATFTPGHRQGLPLVQVIGRWQDELDAGSLW